MGGVADPIPAPGAVDHPVKVSTRRLKSFPLLGKITGIEWRGEDFGAGLLDALNQDRKLVELVKRVGDFEIRSHADEFDGWTIQIRARLSPEKREWATLTQLARRLNNIRY